MSKTTNDRFAVLIAEANDVYCQLLASALGASPYDLQVVGWAVDKGGVLNAVHQYEPDVALIAGELQDGPAEGFEALAAIRKAQLKTRVVMLLNSAEEAQVTDVFRGGAKGVFFRSSPAENVAKCLWSVCRGQVWAGSRELELVVEMLARALPLRPKDSHRTALSKREEQVVRLVAAGLTNREISAELRLSAHTVKNYIFRLYDKLGISNRVELAAYSISQGWPPGVM